jgi:hypothetical protein
VLILRIALKSMVKESLVLLHNHEAKDYIPLAKWHVRARTAFAASPERLAADGCETSAGTTCFTFGP